MNKKEKKELARMMLKRNGYSDSEIKKIVKYAFDDKDNDQRNRDQDNAA